MVRIALDMDDVGRGVLGAVAKAVDQDAAGDGAIGAGVARLGRGGQLERPDGSGQRRAGVAEAKRSETRRRQARARELDELSPTEVHATCSRRKVLRPRE